MARGSGVRAKRGFNREEDGGPTGKKRVVDGRRTNTVKSAAAKKAEWQTRDLEEVEDEEVFVRLDLFRRDGKAVDFATAYEEIRDFLHDHGADATLDAVSGAIGIDMRQPGLLDALRQNPRIEVAAFQAGETLKYIPPFGVRDRRTLEHMLSLAVPTPGDGKRVGELVGSSSAAPELWEGVKRSELRAGATYDGIDADIDDLLFERKVVRVELGERPQRDYVLFAAPPGTSVSEEIKKLWHAEKVPKGEALQRECVANGLVLQSEYEARAKRKAERHVREKERKEAEKRARSRTGMVRKQVNTVDLGI